MHFTVEAQNRCRPWIAQSSIAIDATAGNGFDTIFLAECVGPEGRVYAFDIQSDAIDRTKVRVAQAGYSQRVECVCADHSSIQQYVPMASYGKITCAMFNLGYLPHSDKSVVTRSDSTLKALEAIEPMLGGKFIVSILAYVGHPAGLEESLAVERWIESRREGYRVERLVDLSNPVSPILWLLSRG